MGYASFESQLFAFRKIVIAGLDPAIHVESTRADQWMRVANTRMTIFLNLLPRCRLTPYGGTRARERRRGSSPRGRRRTAPRERSEEHTSELQSLMRTSYDVYCWKQQKMKNI